MQLFWLIRDEKVRVINDDRLLETVERKEGGMRKRWGCILLITFCTGMLSACVGFSETPGERFRKALKEIESACAKRKLDPNEVCGGVTKLKPADPLATEEGRFAHSIKIPNPPARRQRLQVGDDIRAVLRASLQDGGRRIRL